MGTSAFDRVWGSDAPRQSGRAVFDSTWDDDDLKEEARKKRLSSFGLTDAPAGTKPPAPAPGDASRLPSHVAPESTRSAPPKAPTALPEQYQPTNLEALASRFTKPRPDESALGTMGRQFMDVVDIGGTMADHAITHPLETATDIALAAPRALKTEGKYFSDRIRGAFGGAPKHPEVTGLDAALGALDIATMGVPLTNAALRGAGRARTFMAGAAEAGAAEAGDGARFAQILERSKSRADVARKAKQERVLAEEPAYEMDASRTRVMNEEPSPISQAITRFDQERTAATARNARSEVMPFRAPGQPGRSIQEGLDELSRPAIEAARNERLAAAEMNARSATPEDVAAYRRQRDTGIDERPSRIAELPPDEVPFESIGRPRRRPLPPDERAAFDEQRLERQGIQQEMAVGSARTAGGELKRNLRTLSDDDLIDEYVKFTESQNDDMGRSAVSVRMQEGSGTTGGKGAGGYDPVMVRSNDAVNALGRMSQRQKAMDRFAEELARRNIKVEDALWLKHNATDFDPARFPDDIGPPEGQWVDPKTNRPGYAIAGQFGLLLGPGAGATAGAALSPEGKKKEGAMIGGLAGLGLGLAGARGMRALSERGAVRAADEAATTARRADLATEAGTIDRFNDASRKARGGAVDEALDDSFEFERDGIRYKMHADGSETLVERRAGDGAKKTPYIGEERRKGFGELTEKQKARADAAASAASRKGGDDFGIDAVRNARKVGDRRGAIGIPPASTPALKRAAETVAHGERPRAPRAGLLDNAGKAYAGIVSEVSALEKLGRTYDTANPERIAETVAEAQGWGSTARQFVDDHFQSVVDTGKGVERDVQGFVKAQRDQQLRAQGAAAKSDLTDAELAAAVTDGLNNPRVKAGAVQLQQYYRKLLDLKLKNGVISQEKYDAIIQSEDFYTPFVREWAGEQAVRGGGPGGGKFTTKPGGSGRKMDRLQEARAQTVDPYEQALIDTADTFREIGKQRVTNVIADLVDSNPGALQGLVKRINNNAPAGPLARRIETNVGGQKRTYEVLDKDLYEAWASFDQSQLNPVVQALAIPKRGVTAGVVLHPDFAARNFVRDMGQAAIQQPLKQIAARSGAGAAAGAVGGVAFGDKDESAAARAMIGAGLGAGVGAFGSQALKNLRAMSHIIRDTDVYKDFLRSGAVTEGFYPKGALSMRGMMDLKTQRGADARKVLDELRSNGVSAKDIVSPGRWVDALKYIGTVAERSTRLAKFQELGEAGASRGAQVLGAQDVSLRFSNMGKWTKEAAAITPFWNAKVQGWDKLGRLLRNPRTYAAGAAAITAPSLALWAVNKDDPAYWDTNQYVRNLFWMIPKPQSMRDNDAGNFWYIPKPFEIGYFFASLPERLADYAYLKKNGLDDKPAETLGSAIKQMATSTLEGTAPVPTVVRIGVEQMAGEGGWDFFRAQPIVSRPDLPNSMQEDERTSSIARVAGKVGLSPQRVDHIVQGLTGSLGRETLNVTSRVMRAIGADDSPGATSERPVGAGPFWRNEGTAAEPEIALRRRWADAERVYRGARELEKDVKQRGGDASELDTYLAEHRDELVEREELQEAVKALDDISSRRRAVRRDRKLNDKQRKEEIAVLRQIARDIATFGVQGLPQPKDVAERK